MRVKLYHSSTRGQLAGSPLVEGWLRLVTRIAARWICGWLRKRVPSSRAVPRPAVLRVRRRVDAGETASAADEALERGLLRVAQDVAGGEEEDDRPVAPRDWS